MFQLPFNENSKNTDYYNLNKQTDIGQCKCMSFKRIK